MLSRHAAVWLLGCSLRMSAGGATPARRLYVDRATGVTFSYPAGWLLNGDDDAATAKFRITSVGQPDVVVQLEGNFAEDGPYEGTDFESGAFAYVVTAGGSEAGCFAVVESSAEGAQAPITANWNGLRARRLDATYTVAGTDDIHRLVAVFRDERCYLFETSIIKRSADTVAKPLSRVKWKAIQSEFDSVLASVRLATVRLAPGTVKPRATEPGR